MVGDDGRKGGVGTIRARGLDRRFGERQAVDSIDLDWGPGGVIGLVGPNGSGKSTLLRMLVGVVRPDAGEVEIDGVALRGDGLAVRKRCAYSPGEIALYKELRGDEHLRFLLRGRGRSAFARGRAVAEELELPLGERVQAYTHGMKRQLLFAAAMAPDVRVRLLDEPTVGLDPVRRAQLLDIVRRDVGAGSTVVFSSHHFGEVGAIATRLVFLDRGKVARDADPADLPPLPEVFRELYGVEGI